MKRENSKILKIWNKGTMILFALASCVAMGADSPSKKPSDEEIKFYFHAVTGLSLRKEAAAFQDVKDIDELFDRLFSTSYFYDNRVASFVSILSNEDGAPFESLDDYQTALLLAINSGIDIRDLFLKQFRILKKGKQQPVDPYFTNGNFGGEIRFSEGLATSKPSGIKEIYELNFDEMAYGEEDSSSSDSDEPAILKDYSNQYDGLLTTQGFGQRFFKGGTNRRPVRAMFDIFLCSKIESLKDPTLDPFYIGRDVDRSPSDKPYHFDQECSSCHSWKDAFRGGFSTLDYAEDDNSDERTRMYTGPVEKMNRNSQNYEDGFIISDDHWQNLFVRPMDRIRFGFRGPNEGYGHISLTRLFVDSEQFQRCMVRRVSQTFCGQSETRLNMPDLNTTIQQVAESFRDQNYNMKSLIKNVVRSPLCHR